MKKVIFTDRSVKSVDALLKVISKFPILSNDEERDLWERMQQGSRAARERLINCNLRYVVTMAKKYLWSGVSFEDLINTGAIGLTLAADRFDATRGYRFLSYAVWWVDAELKKAVTEHWPYQQMSSLDAPLTTDDDDERTLLDVIESHSEQAPDWAVSYLSEMAVAKQRVRDKFFDEAATIFEDAVKMKTMGLSLYDVARKHRVGEEQLRQLLKMVTKDLEKDLLPKSYRTAA